MIIKFWDDSKIGLNEVFDEILHKVNEYLDNLRTIIESKIQLNKEFESFFEDLPWEKIENIKVLTVQNL